LAVIRRGDVVTVALPGDYGKPRPAVVLQNDLMAELNSVVVCPVTTDPTAAVFRVPLEPTPANGLERRSQVMVDKVTAVSRRRIGAALGSADAATMRAVASALVFVAGLS
jgi:mRNA interferase MazF